MFCKSVKIITLCQMNEEWIFEGRNELFKTCHVSWTHEVWFEKSPSYQRMTKPSHSKFFLQIGQLL
jgi:hypothetical protein